MIIPGVLQGVLILNRMILSMMIVSMITKAEALFDVRVTDTNVTSYVSLQSCLVLRKRRSASICQQLSYDMPLLSLLSVNGTFGHEALMFLHDLCYCTSNQLLLLWVTCVLTKWDQY